VSAEEWITKRRHKTGLFCDRFGDTAGVGGVVALVAEDLPRALDALDAVLKIVQTQEYKTPGNLDTYDQWHEARNALADEIESAIEKALET
jgi:hypothetical protein